MGLRKFFTSRLIRLQPLVIMGTILGLAGFLFDPFASQPPTQGAGQIILLTLTSLLMIPFPILAERYFNLFNLNAPAWSLFWEYVANIIYALVLHKISRRLLIVLTLVAAMVLGMVSYRAGNLLGGWSKDNFGMAAPVLAFPF
ncbi:hypothetical protein [Paraflavitalea speifideaquila]|uniref:hypothetical protein n=1 Tax=Paraflavitalea speifideaquila TaxID=3076558 RepID=UPI0028E3B108|nr:hypothetical protein [Paraflavitalea speifideiaquila]